MLAPPVALRRILAALADTAPLPPERVPLAEAVGRALAEDVRAPGALPAFDASTMDGYALRARDARAAGARLPVAYEVFAGRPAPGPLPPGACCRIYTGAPLPRGADAVEQQEQVRRSGRLALFLRPAEAGRFVRPAGSDVRAGSAPLRAGAVLDPGSVGLAAALGRTDALVRRRPRVAILPTGDELVPAGRRPGPGQIVESNGRALAAAAREAGAEALVLPAARDDAASLRAALRRARGVDALVTVGGVSVGAKDLVRGALRAAGARIGFWRVAMRPGKPFTFGRWGRTAVFGLPGNPASALVTFELFVRPALRAMAGLPGSGRAVLPARLAAPLEKPAELTVYARARIARVGGELWVEPLRTQVSGNLTSAAGVGALAVLPAGRTRLARGARVEAILLGVPE